MEISATMPAQAAVPTSLSERHAVSIGLAGTLLVCGLIFGLLHHPWWMRGGDGEVYIGMARSLLRGEGYRFNGQPVSIVPPLWIWALAGAMKITTSFATLKLLTIALLLIGIAAYYFVLLRITTPLMASCVLIATALGPQVYEMVFWFFQEPMFFALLGLAVLLALQINEGADQMWRIGALAVLCIALVGVRWAGLLMWPLIAGALLNGENFPGTGLIRRLFLGESTLAGLLLHYLFPRPNRRWFAVVLTGVCVLTTFVALRRAFNVPMELVNPRYDPSIAVAYDTFNTTSWEDYLKRITDAGRWLVGLYWNLMMHTPGLRAFVDIVGWLGVILLLFAGWSAVQARQWFIVGLLLYFGMLVINWTSAVPRYLMPVAPLLLGAMVVGVREFKRMFNPRVEAAVGRWMRPVILTSIILCGLPMYAIELRHARSASYAAKVFGGTDRQLVSAAQHLRQVGAMDGDIAVTISNANLGQMYRYTNGWMRSLNVLTGGLSIRTPPKKYSGPPDKTVMRWLRGQKIKYYLYYNPQRLRLTHFHSYDEAAGQIRPRNDWELWDVSGVKPRLIPLRKECDWPTHVPGL